MLYGQWNAKPMSCNKCKAYMGPDNHFKFVCSYVKAYRGIPGTAVKDFRLFGVLSEHQKATQKSSIFPLISLEVLYAI